uniref:CASTOR ACT domain-containing protein n=1 Tax=Streptoalloteichus sp. ATCC 53650 TaxID=756733 RepID=K4PC71_9PSEU|nr:hypothetical protein [Streptoalloteichus sp. ATCC 53650]
MADVAGPLGERAVFTDLTHDLTGTAITVRTDGPGDVPAALAAAGAIADLLTAWPSASGFETRFVVPRDRLAAVLAALAAAGRRDVRVVEVVRLAVHGIGIRVEPAVVARIRWALGAAGVDVLAASVSNRRITVVCPEGQLNAAIGALRGTFAPESLAGTLRDVEVTRVERRTTEDAAARVGE